MEGSLREGQHMAVLLCTEWAPAAWRYCLFAPAGPDQLPGQLSLRFLVTISGLLAPFYFSFYPGGGRKQEST